MGGAEKGPSLHCTQGRGARTSPHRAAALPPNTGAGGATCTAEGAQVCPEDQSHMGCTQLFPESQEYPPRAQPRPLGRPAPAQDPALFCFSGWDFSS